MLKSPMENPIFNPNLRNNLVEAIASRFSRELDAWFLPIASRMIGRPAKNHDDVREAMAVMNNLELRIEWIILNNHPPTIEACVKDKQNNKIDSIILT